MLNQISVHNLTYTYESSPEAVLSDVSMTFSHGWTGIVGNNGTGKTTLLRIVSGALGGFEGNLNPDPSSYGGVYCAQPTEYLPDNAKDFALDYSADAVRLRSILDVDEDWIWRFDTLSHGERKRLQIAVALWQNPAVLALDEPTNHIDAATREQLVRALKHYDGVGLLVSHDRAFLDALVFQCLFFEDGKIVMRPGSYSEARSQSELERKTIIDERKSAKASLRQISGEKARRAEVATRADAKSSKRHTNPKDHSAKAQIDLARLTGQDGKAGKLSVQMDTKLKAAEKRLASAHVAKRYEGDIWVDGAPAKRGVLVTLPEGSISMGERLLHHPTLYVGNTDHIGLSGQNGAGKSTLVNAIMTALPNDVRSHTLYIPQELTISEGREVLEELRGLGKDEQGRVLSAVAQLNSPPTRILSGDNLSPGELRKVMLAMGIVRSPYLIVMDEPTNHLDIHSTEALERVLSDCPCALILVSHDTQFLSALTEASWDFTIDSVTRDTTVSVR